MSDEPKRREWGPRDLPPFRDVTPKRAKQKPVKPPADNDEETDNG